MDILVKSVLNYVQSMKGHENTVLAGGAVRDIFLGLTPNDYDFVIPSVNAKDIHQLAQSVVQEFGVTDMVCKTHDYRSSKKKKLSVDAYDQGLTCVYGFTFEGKKIDLIGHNLENDPDFPEICVKKFDFGINMIYDTGDFIRDDIVEFEQDTQWGQMSLINLDSMSNLPNAVRRYENFNARYKAAKDYPLTFRAPCLELIRQKPQEEPKKKYKPTPMTGLGLGTFGATQGPQWDPFQQTVADTFGQTTTTTPAWGTIQNAQVTATPVFDDAPLVTPAEDFFIPDPWDGEGETEQQDLDNF